MTPKNYGLAETLLTCVGVVTVGDCVGVVAGTASAEANVVCVGVETGAGRLGSDDGVTALFDMAGADTDLGTVN